jgi:hypothetical protein
MEREVIGTATTSERMYGPMLTAMVGEKSRGEAASGLAKAFCWYTDG